MKKFNSIALKLVSSEYTSIKYTYYELINKILNNFINYSQWKRFVKNNIK